MQFVQRTLADLWLDHLAGAAYIGVNKITFQKEYKMTLQSTYRNWRNYRHTVASLNRLNERQLEDLGIQREQISDVARRSSF